MTRRYVAVIVALVAGGSLTACGSKTHSASTNPQVRQNEAKAQAIVKRCISHGNLLTKSGRQKVLRCIAPPGQEVQFQACARRQVAKSSFLTKKQRQQATQNLATCLEKVK